MKKLAIVDYFRTAAKIPATGGREPLRSGLRTKRLLGDHALEVLRSQFRALTRHAGHGIDTDYGLPDVDPNEYHILLVTGVMKLLTGIPQSHRNR